MGKWKIWRRTDGQLEVDYTRPSRLGVFKAGTMHAWTDPMLIVAWIVDQDATAAGDVITLPDHSVLVMLGRPTRTM